MLLVGLGFATVILARSAWVSDDAFITLRTVANALDGHGLRFNVDERVQAFTHPLWMLGLLGSHALIADPWYAAAGLGLLVTLGGLGWLLSRARSLPSAVLLLAAATGSKALMDYGTSGLENPLSHLMLLGMFASVRLGGSRPRDIARSTLLLALGLTNRLDAALLLGPLWALHIGRSERSLRTLGAVLAGLLPWLSWEAFALVYYGSLVPNTAYAKLGSGLGLLERLRQGSVYLAHPFWYDRVTAAGLIAAPLLLLVARTAAQRGVLLGALMHAAYVLWVGGDFMAGRFLTPVLFAVLVVLSDLELPDRTAGGLAAGLTLLSLLGAGSPLRAGADYRRLPPWSGVVDERGFYHQGAGWLGSERPGFDHRFAAAGRRARDRGRRSVTRATAGYFGYYAGPDVHVTDPLGLTEPLLARLPARYDPNWRIGHHRRPTIPGYDPLTGHPPDDPALADLHARVVRLTRGPLLAPSRWADGLRLQFAPPELPPTRFLDALPVGPGPTMVEEAGVCTAIGPDGPPTIQVRPPVHTVYVAAGRALSAGTSDQPGPRPSGADTLCLFPRARGVRQQVLIGSGPGRLE